MIVKLLLAGLGVGAMALVADRPFGRASSGRSAVLARNGMVATSQPLASQAGLRILRQGGNAIDAAVATAAVLAVVEPMMTGPGGDLFVLAYIAETDELVGLNASGFAPEKTGIDFFQSRGLKSIQTSGPFSVTVPGAVEGWAMLLEKHGTMSLGQVLAPAIEYAEEGFAVSEIIAGTWKTPAIDAGTSQAKQIVKDFEAAYYLNGRRPEHGDVFVNKPLADTFRKIAAEGPEVFYKGEIARKIVDHLNG